MTESEAIKEVRFNMSTIGLSDKSAKRVVEARDMAINALEKQIAKKPEHEADGYAGGKLVYDYAKCPICGHDFESGINDWGCEYCSVCGQKLDFGE